MNFKVLIEVIEMCKETKIIFKYFRNFVPESGIEKDDKKT